MTTTDPEIQDALATLASRHQPDVERGLQAAQRPGFTTIGHASNDDCCVRTASGSGGGRSRFRFGRVRARDRPRGVRRPRLGLTTAGVLEAPAR
jgi:hypothetical protein